MKDDKNNVVDVEVVNEEHDSSRKNGRTYTTTYYYAESGDGTGRTSYTYHDMFGLHAPGRDGLQYAGIITLTLFFFCLFRWGFLAALGFAFFETVGSAFGLWFNLRTVLLGRVPNPWISRAIVWALSLGLVSLLV